MDYSNYYLKNYFKNRDTDSRESINMRSEIADEEDPRRDFAGGDSEYVQSGNVEIEVVPQLTGMVHTNYKVDEEEEEEIIDIVPQAYDRADSKRKVWIMSLTIITCMLLTVVIGDFASGGALLAGISSLYRTQALPKSSFYALVLKSSDNYSGARIYADQIRLLGGAGYIVKNGDRYIVIGDIYDDLSEANGVVEKNEGSELISYTVEEIDFDKVFSGNSPLMKTMGGYSLSVINQLAVIGDNLATAQIDKARAVEQIGGIYDNLKMQFDELSAESNTKSDAVKLLMNDLNVSLGLLSNLSGDSVSRPNLLCDIRYTKVQMTLNYCQMISSLSD